ncbi:MAG: MBL fold metallo-hydrolase [Robiginitomaculum sp.]|nr:MAG: MBL fold metallo-hydrolase [Robiginitomaculum sp.]
MTTAQIKSFFDEPTNTVTYVVSDPDTKHCAIIDSVLGYEANSGRTETHAADAVIAYIRDKNLHTEWILETHVHADHLSAAPYLRDTLGGKIAIGSHIPDVQKVFGGVFNEDARFKRDGSQFDHLFKDGETFNIGNIAAKIIYTPGHTPACVTYHIDDVLFIGDTLFMPDYGSARCDFPGGDAATLYRSVQKIYAFPNETRLYLCHDYLTSTRDTYCWETTVGAQKKSNIHLNEDISEADFVAMRTTRDATLSMPRLILPSIQINMRAGEFPPAEDNGQHYLKIPLNAL